MSIRFLLFGSLLVSLLFGCDPSSSSTRTQKIVVYSPHGVEVLKPVEKAFEAAYPEIDLVWFDLPTSSCVSKIRAERENPQADVWWGGPIAEFIAMEKTGLLSAYTPSWKAEASSSTYSKESKWYTNWQTPEVIMYNAKKVSREEVPKDWDALLDPKWKGRVAIRDPSQSGTMKTIYGAMILRAADEKAGFEWLKKLDIQNGGKYAGKPAIMYEQLKRGAADLTLWNMADAYIQKEQNGYPFEFVVPTSGTPVVLEGISILNQAPHRKTAEVFFEFVTSSKALIEHAKKFHRIPISRKDLNEAELPKWMTAQPIKTMEIDWEEFSVKSTEWMEYWKKNIQGTGRN